MRSWKALWLTRIAVLSLGLSVFAACDDDGGPAGDLDPTEAAAALDNVVADYFDDNAALQSLGFFGAFLGDALSPAVVPAAAVTHLGGGTVEALKLGAQTSVVEWQSWRASNAGSPARIPVGLLRSTFVWDPLLEPAPGYRIEESRSDEAPDNGVRFILYAVDPISQQPISPLTEIGYLDIIDTSDFPTINISMTAFIEGRGTLLDVDVSGTFGASSLTISTDGSVSNGQQTLSFSFDVSGTASSSSDATVSLDFEFTFASFRATLDFDGEIVGEDLGAGSFTATLTDLSNDGSVVFSLGVDDLGNITEGSGVRLNGQQVAIISGTIEETVITNAQGDPLTPAELQALEDLFEGIGDIFEAAFGVFAFSLFLIFLGAA